MTSLARPSASRTPARRRPAGAPVRAQDHDFPEDDDEDDEDDVDGDEP